MPTSQAAELPPWLEQARRRGILSRLPDDVVAGVIRGGRRATYPGGAMVPAPEERAWSAIVLRGCMRVFVPASEGAQVTLRYMRAGDIIGAFDGTTTALARSVQTICDSEVLHLDADNLQTLARTAAPFAYEMLVEAMRTLRLAHRAYGIRAFGSVRLRVANAILDRARACGTAGTGTVVSGTQHELAIATGTVREVVATVLHGLKEEGIVDVHRGRLVIRDFDRLFREADGGLGLAGAID